MELLTLFRFQLLITCTVNILTQQKSKNASVLCWTWDWNSSLPDLKAVRILDACCISWHHTSFTCFHWTTPLPQSLSVWPRLLMNSYKSRSVLLSASLFFQRNSLTVVCAPALRADNHNLDLLVPHRCYDFLLTAQLLQLCTNTWASLVFAAGLWRILNSKLNELTFI